MQKSTKIQRRQRRIKRILSFIIAITITIILFGFLLSSDFFNINQINIKGNSNIPMEKLLHTSSINIGENIFRISRKYAEESIMELPYVKSVTINRRLPKGIDIEVIERENKFLVKNISMYYIIDEEGYILNEIDSILESLPVVLGLKTDRIDLGDNLFNILELEEFEDFIKESENSNLLRDMEIIDIDGEDNINISTKNGIDIAFGPMDNVKYKIRLLDEILIHSKDNDISIDKIIMNRGEHPIIVVDD